MSATLDTQATVQPGRKPCPSQILRESSLSVAISRSSLDSSYRRYKEENELFIKPKWSKL